jgi:quinol monooxygenase YgiN
VPQIIIVTGEVVARPETAVEIRRLAMEHVARSRAEPGCISHDVHADLHDPLRLVFVERWADAAALKAHFAVPASRAFGRALAGLAAGAPSMQVYEAGLLAL